MKIFALFLIVNGEKSCTIQVKSREDCQIVCDHAETCEAWTFRENLNHCYLKARYGWTHQPCPNCDSGFKNQGPWYDPNTDFEGGDVDCIDTPDSTV